MSYAANPRADNPQEGGRETTGPVTSDSLAAESIRAGEGFAENEDASIQGVRGSNSTFNTTDTSGATALRAARDGATREKQDVMGLGSDERGVTGPKYPEGIERAEFDGVHSQEGYVGGASRDGSGETSGYSGATGDSFRDGGAGLAGDYDSSRTAQVSSSRGDRDTSYGISGGRDRDGDEPLVTGRAGEDFGTASRPERDTAPNYAGTVSGAIQPEGYGKPKGSNLVEGDVPQTRTFTGDVGGVHDPGRLAEKDFDKMGSGSTVASGERQYRGDGSSSDNPYDALESRRI